MLTLTGASQHHRAGWTQPQTSVLGCLKEVTQCPGSGMRGAHPEKTARAYPSQDPQAMQEGAQNSGRGHIQAKPRGCRVCQKGRVREVLDELCWTQELVGGSGMKAGDTREFHPCSGWAEPIPYSLSPCQSQPPWDSELPKALNLCLPRA